MIRCLVLLLFCAQALAVEVRLDTPLKVHLADALKQAPFDQRRAFVAVALDQMIAAYRIELRRVDGSGSARSGQWAKATRAWLGQLESQRANLDRSASVQVVAELLGPLRLVVDGSPIIVSGPDIIDQEQLEENILTEYCSRWICDFPEETMAERIHRQARDTPGQWSLGDRYGAVFETADGLRCLFENMSDLGRKRDVCERLFEELRVLGDSLYELLAQGFTVDWDYVQLRGAAVAENRSLVLNHAGDYLPLQPGLLDERAALWFQARPWIEARAEGRSESLYLRDVEALLP